MRKNDELCVFLLIGVEGVGKTTVAERFINSRKNENIVKIDRKEISDFVSTSDLKTVAYKLGNKYPGYFDTVLKNMFNKYVKSKKATVLLVSHALIWHYGTIAQPILPKSIQNNNLKCIILLTASTKSIALRRKKKGMSNVQLNSISAEIIGEYMAGFSIAIQTGTPLVLINNRSITSSVKEISKVIKKFNDKNCESNA